MDQYQRASQTERVSLDSSEHTLLDKEELHISATPQRRTFWSRIRPFLFHSALVLTNIVICGVVIKNTKSELQEYTGNLIESPARSAMHDVQTQFILNRQTIKPWFNPIPGTQEVEDNWDQLLGISTFAYTQDEMERWGRTEEGVWLQDGSGYLGTLNVFHELHCLRRIYMYIHYDHYYGDWNLTEYQKSQNLAHTMHCLEAVRLGTKCRGDISPVTYRFKPTWKVPVANWSSPHECKDWDAIMDWTKEHTVDPYKPGLVVHPTLGPSYEGGTDVELKLGVTLDKEPGYYAHEHLHLDEDDD